MNKHNTNYLQPSHNTAAKISSLLTEWYKTNQRDLPWRNTTDPYKIWISEIILQQTRVKQGLDYYYRFTERFPDIRILAEADVQEVLKYWQGLGYYSRARNLHETAKTILSVHTGIFPQEFAQILQLKGIGEYTAAAIASFAWNQPYPVVDGNVFRFLSRLFAIEEPIDTSKGKKLFTEIAYSLLNREHAGLHNQAIMEFGALYCVPVSPICQGCPFETLCMANKAGSVSSLPVKKTKVKTRNRYFNYLHIEHKDQFYLQQRTGKDIWLNLFEFPMIESDGPLSFAELLQHPEFRRLFPFPEKINVRQVIENKKHILSHQVIRAGFYRIKTIEEPVAADAFEKTDYTGLDNYPLHRLMESYFENTGKKIE